MRGTITINMFHCVPELDYNTGYHYFLGNMNNYSQALMSTLKSIKSKLPILNAMLITNEYEGLRTITQTLRRMFGNIGANELSEVSYQLEMTLISEEEDQLQEALISYINQLLELSDHLELLFQSIASKDNDADSKTEDTRSFLNYDFSKTKESIKLSTNLLERKII